MAEINYKQKYMELRLKFMNSIDAAFRQGFEQGTMDAQMQQAQDQQAQAQEAAQSGMGQPGQPGQPAQGDPSEPGEEQAPDSMNPQGSELDQHIAKLEGMLGKSEFDKNDLKKAIEELKLGIEMKKSAQAIPAIAKALHKPAFKMAAMASYNLNDSAKRGVHMQQKIVTDIMKSWADEELKASKGIHGILGIEGLTKGE